MSELSAEQATINELYVALEAMVRTYRAVHIFGSMPESMMQFEASKAMEVLRRLKDKTV